MDPAELSSPFVDHLGIELTEASGSRVVARWTADERHHQPYGIVHGGVYAAAIETMGSIGGAMAAQDRGLSVVGVNNNTHFLAAVSEGRVDLVAVPIVQGRTQQLWTIDVTRASDGRLVATGQLRLQNIEPRA